MTVEYPALVAEWQTPKGNTALIHYRDNTSDWNTVNSIMAPNDEYGLKELSLSGLAMDIGAHIGAASIALAMDNPGLRVIAVEPVPDNCDLIRRNVFANGLAAYVRVIEGAAGKSGSRMVRFGFTGNANDEHHAFIGDARDGVPEGSYTSKRVNEYSLADLYADPICFMKLDCEGGEFAFLDADLSGIERIHGEWHPIPPYGAEGREVIDKLLSSTHTVEFKDPVAGPAGFIAIRA